MDVSRRRFLRTASVAATAGVAGCTGQLRTVTGGPSAPAAATADAQFRGEPTRRGVYPDAQIPTSATVDWQVADVNTGDHTAAKASPVLAPNGDVVVPGDSGDVLAVRPDGEVRWRADVTNATRGFHGTPAIANDTVYVGAYDGGLCALDLASGERHWRVQLGDAIGSSPGYLDGTVYVAVEYYEPSGAMFGVDAVTGDVVWEDQRPTDHPHSTAAIDVDSGRVVVGSNDGDLYAWSYPDHEFQWTFATGEPIKGPVATGDGSAFFGSWDDHVYRVALDDGTEEWAFEAGGSVMSGPAVEPGTGTVYVGTHDSNTYALDVASGESKWEFATGGTILGCPVVTREHVLVGAYDRTLYALDKADGEEQWRVETGGWVTSTPLVTDDAVYVTSRASTTYLDDGDGPTGALYRIVADD
jgi:outer membrane protein assembly factor BamB